MTVEDMKEWLDDGDFFVDDSLEVLFFHNGVVLEIDGTCIPENGPVKIFLRPAKDYAKGGGEP